MCMVRAGMMSLLHHHESLYIDPEGLRLRAECSVSDIDPVLAAEERGAESQSGLSHQRGEQQSTACSVHMHPPLDKPV